MHDVFTAYYWPLRELYGCKMTKNYNILKRFKNAKFDQNSHLKLLLLKIGPETLDDLRSGELLVLLGSNNSCKLCREGHGLGKSVNLLRGSSSIITLSLWRHFYYQVLAVVTSDDSS